MSAQTNKQAAATEWTGHIEACSLLKAMSNETRLMILCRLLEDEKSVTELENLIGLSQSAISQHLAVLRENGLVNAKREGQSIRYSMAGSKPKAIIEMLYQLYSECPAPDIT